MFKDFGFIEVNSKKIGGGVIPGMGIFKWLGLLAVILIIFYIANVGDFKDFMYIRLFPGDSIDDRYYLTGQELLRVYSISDEHLKVIGAGGVSFKISKSSYKKGDMDVISLNGLHFVSRVPNGLQVGLTNSDGGVTPKERRTAVHYLDK